MDNCLQERRWFWTTLVLSSVTIVALVFAFWELVENRFFRDLDYVSLHYLYISRGVTASVLLAIWAGWFVTRQRRIAEAQLRKSHERYRGLLEASPGAIVLYDRNLCVLEWNASGIHAFAHFRLASRVRTVGIVDGGQLGLLVDENDRRVGHDLFRDRQPRPGN